MTETQTINWDLINATDTIDEAALAASEDISAQSPVGKFICTIMEPVEAIEKQFKAYSCYAAKLKMRIDAVLKIEQPVFDDKGAPIKRNGDFIMKVQDVPADKLAAISAKYSGRFVFDEIPLAHPKEKEAMKNRRLFVARRIGIISPQSVQLTSQQWQGAANRQVVIITEWNTWTDKDTDEKKKNVKVAWDGYDYAPANGSGGWNGGNGKPAPGHDTSFDPAEFDI
jgi:hypothetical protein